MTHHHPERNALLENVWQRRDTAPTSEQEEEVRQSFVAFRHTRVLLSRARLRAESFLQRN